MKYCTTLVQFLKKINYNQMRRISFLIFLAISLILNSCSYGAPVTDSKIVNVLRIPDGWVIAILVQRTTLKRPEGIATFPDGGKPKILRIELSIYLFDIDKNQLRTLLVFKNPPDQVIAFDSWLKGWDGEDLYFQTRGCASTWEVERHGCGEAQTTSQYFKVNGQGVSQRVTMIPPVLNDGRNSPLIAEPNEINYTRVSLDRNSIDVTITDPNNFYKLLKLDNQGNLKRVE